MIFCSLAFGLPRTCIRRLFALVAIALLIFTVLIIQIAAQTSSTGTVAVAYSDASGRLTLSSVPVGVQHVEIDYAGLDRFGRDGAGRRRDGFTPVKE